jgi:hypothetical protein
MFFLYLYVVNIYNLFCSAVLDGDYVVTELVEIFVKCQKVLNFILKAVLMLCR